MKFREFWRKPKSFPAETLNRKWRPDKGFCPQCGASEKEWCQASCSLLDPMDWR
jgi:hypothetical protein